MKASFDFTFLRLTYFLRCLQISVDWQCFSYNLVGWVSFNWSNIFWENWIPTDLHNRTDWQTMSSVENKHCQMKSKVYFVYLLTLSLGVYCHTIWWNDSLTSCVLHFSTETKNYFPIRSNNGSMTFTTAPGNGFLIGLWNELPVATSLWKLHQPSLSGEQRSCNLSSL